ncbi:MAG: response regulator transcription factor, partial [Leptolyngbyaceae cyanobacterium RU_5_1]|nr:response regulator transcription factor [Leptolyngbyaceae cyanobacterium RU_5_1]
YTPRLNESKLTPRQKDIVNLIAKGFTNNEIAEQLSVSVHTVKNHKSLLYRKVDVRNTMELLGASRAMQMSDLTYPHRYQENEI